MLKAGGAVALIRRAHHGSADDHSECFSGRRQLCWQRWNAASRSGLRRR